MQLIIPRNNKFKVRQRFTYVLTKSQVSHRSRHREETKPRCCRQRHASSSRAQMVRGCLPSKFHPSLVWQRKRSARGAGDGARCACFRRASELLYSQRHRAFLPSYHPPYCCRSVRSVCLCLKQEITPYVLLRKYKS